MQSFCIKWVHPQERMSCDFTVCLLFFTFFVAATAGLLGLFLDFERRMCALEALVEKDKPGQAGAELSLRGTLREVALKLLGQKQE